VVTEDSQESKVPIDIAWCHINYINIYYSTSGRAVQENIEFKAGSIGPTIGGPIQKPRTGYSPVLPKLRSAIIYLLHDQALASLINGLDNSSGRKWWCQSYVKPFQGGRLQFRWIINLEALFYCSLSVVSIGFSRERTASNSQCHLW